MYCPKCGTHNSDDTKFCRQCGGNLTLVLQSMAGELPQGRAVGWDAAGYPYDAQGRRIDQGPPTLGNGVRDISRGALSLAGIIIVQILTDWPLWWLLFVLPQTIYFLSEGIGKIVQAKHEELSIGQLAQKTGSLSESAIGDGGKRVYEQLPAPSVVEHTTRSLESTGNE
jgi:hypothetical protein